MARPAGRPAWACLGLIACAVTVGLQSVLLRQAVGSALYAPVQPLFASGILPALLTWLVFSRHPRKAWPRLGMGLVCLLWLLAPLAVDAMYLEQGGYRGTGELAALPVLGTAAGFLTSLLGVGFFLAFLILPVAVIAGGWILLRSPAADRLPVLAMLLSVVALCLQVINWGGFVWD